MITFMKMDFTGEEVPVRIGRLVSTDTLTDVAVAGYVDSYLQGQNIALEPTDMIAVAASDGNGWFYPTLANGSWTLNAA